MSGDSLPIKAFCGQSVEASAMWEGPCVAVQGSGPDTQEAV